MYGLTTHGMSKAQIAELLGVSVDVADRYLTEVLADFSRTEDVAAIRNFEMMKLDALEQWIWKQAEKSGKKGAANPAYARALVEVYKHRAKTLGLEAPRRLQIDSTEQKLTVNIIEVRTREDIARLDAQKAIASDTG